MHDGTEDRGSRQSGSSEVHTDQFFAIAGAELPPNYSLIRMLGQGSMAHVFLARNTALKRLVAIKVLRKEMVADSVGRKRFIREAQAAARISHPSVTSIYTVGTLSNDDPFIEMQYVDGNNLAETLRSQGRFDVSAARKLLGQLSAALAAAHECGVIHRDVEPANVLIEPEGDGAFLTDFGVAGILESGSEAVTQLTREGDRLGDPTYMSPEQVRGEVLTPQSDIYSLGLLGYEMLTLHGPFGDSEITDMAGAHMRRPPIDLHEVYPDIPRDLGDILKRCLSKKPEHRPRAKVLANMFEHAGPIKSDTTLSSLEETTLPGAVASFLHELRERKVYRAAVAYAAATFVILQVADLILPSIPAPAWVYRLFVVASLAGFPVAMALAWVFDLQQGRLMRTEESGASFTRRASPGQRLLLQVLGMALSIAVAVTIAWLLLDTG